MALILNNSRDINNKFLFGHWMMRNSDGQLSFRGPGYGRVFYWPIGDNLEGVEKDMIEMRKKGLKGYAIHLTGAMQENDGCWKCCEDDDITPECDLVSPPGSATITWPETDGEINMFGHYFDREPPKSGETSWYDEVKDKYKKLLKLCRKYNLWLLVFVMSKRGRDPNTEGMRSTDAWLGWINAFPDSSNEAGTSSAGRDGIHDNLSRRKELADAISHSPYKFGWNGKSNPKSDAKWGPTNDELKKLVNDVLIPCNGKERVLVCPIDEPVTDEDEEFETWCINTLKSRGFATCIYSEDDNKGKARMCQGGHQDAVSKAKCKNGMGVSDNDDMLIELYPGEAPSEEEEYNWRRIDGNKTADTAKVKTLMKNYRNSSAKGGVLYAINYGEGGHEAADVNAISAIKEGWNSGSSGGGGGGGGGGGDDPTPTSRITLGEGPGYGRICYWPSSLAAVKADMEAMKARDLKCYIIEMTGKLASDDGNWSSAYFSSAWYDEVATKYMKLLKYAQNNDLWVLNLVFNDNQWQKNLSPRPTKAQVADLIELAYSCGYKKNLVICPINEPETEDGVSLENTYIPKIKKAGFKACSYGSIKQAAQYYQSGHKSSVEAILSEDLTGGFGVCDNGGILCELYNNSDWHSISKTDTATPAKVKQMMINYKAQNAKAAFLYAIHYGASTVDTAALNAIRQGWYNLT